jgi:hypothetical protein
MECGYLTWGMGIGDWSCRVAQLTWISYRGGCKYSQNSIPITLTSVPHPLSTLQIHTTGKQARRGRHRSIKALAIEETPYQGSLKKPFVFIPQRINDK